VSYLLRMRDRIETIGNARVTRVDFDHRWSRKLSWVQAWLALSAALPGPSAFLLEIRDDALNFQSENCWTTGRNRRNKSVSISHKFSVLAIKRDHIPIRAFKSSDYPTLAVPTFKLKKVGERSFCAAGPRA